MGNFFSAHLAEKLRFRPGQVVAGPSGASQSSSLRSRISGSSRSIRSTTATEASRAHPYLHSSTDPYRAASLNARTRVSAGGSVRTSIPS